MEEKGIFELGDNTIPFSKVLNASGFHVDDKYDWKGGSGEVSEDMRAVDYAILSEG
jgi:hypothetical protein